MDRFISYQYLTTKKAIMITNATRYQANVGDNPAAWIEQGSNNTIPVEFLAENALDIINKMDEKPSKKC